MLDATLADLKVGLCGSFCGYRFTHISAFLPIASQQRQGPETEKASASCIKTMTNRSILNLVCVHQVPSVARDNELGA